MTQQNTVLTQSLPQGTTIRKVAKTAASEGAKQRTHTFVFNFAGVKVHQLMDDFVRSLVIKVQGQMRKHPENFPEGEVKVNVLERVTRQSSGIQITEGTAKAYIASLSDEAREKFIAQYR